MSSSPVSRSSPAFDMPSVPPSTAPSSPPPADASSGSHEEEHQESEQKFSDDEEVDRRYKRLQFVLKKSAIFSQILKERMDEHKHKQKEAAAASSVAKTTVRRGKGRKRTRVESDESGEEAGDTKRLKKEDGQAQRQQQTDDDAVIFEQPALVTGGKLKDYQLEGLQWMVSLDQNGISGILADEMGLGKTLQAIAFSAYLREHKNSRPFLIVCPLNVLHNWVDEYAKFAPSIPVCMYHGTPAERAELRRTVMAPTKSTTTSKKPSKTTKAKGRSAKKSKTAPKKGPRRGGRLAKKASHSDDDKQSGSSKIPIDVDEEAGSEDEEENPFPVVITTYEMIIKDRVYLANYDWGYIVVDEGHRLKNLDCKLMKEIKKYPSAGRMLLTGTPLHNNLAELWSLLNFILPDIFDDVDAFQEWFNLPTMEENLGSARSGQIINALHAILKPFLLRRLKSDVEYNLPPKKEYILYAPLTVQQRETYDKVLEGTLRSFLIGQAAEKKTLPMVEEKGPMHLRSKERGIVENEEQKELKHLGVEHQYKAAVKQVNNMKLQNTVMQLRKVCSHPYLFDWPLDPKTHQPTLDEGIVNASGKMMVLDRLLRELFRTGHKVLLFSQFTTMLDIIEDWATELMGWKICRIDGSTSPLNRRNQMKLFQNSADPASPNLFLLSTRAGGLGINLTAADTVIFYDQDWNPQMDAQAQDRAHRIGQTRPVLIFRLVSAHTIETKIMQRATEKRKLEALVIAKGKFKKPAMAAGRSKPETMAEMAASLLKLEGEKIDVVPNTTEGKASVLSDEDLNMLLDRSPEVFVDRVKGWTSSGDHIENAEDREGGIKGAGEHAKKTAFAVYEAPVHQGNDALANMLGEETD